MRAIFNNLLAVICAILSSIPLLLNAAENTGDTSVGAPAALVYWQDWITHEHPELKCSQGPQQLRRNCQWRSPLNLIVSEKTINFSFDVLLESAAWVPLPGDIDSWPSSVLVNSVKARLMSHHGSPAVYLEAAQYQIEGKILQRYMPLSLKLPAATSFIKLSINGKDIPQPSFDQQRLLLDHSQNKTAKTTDNLNVQVYRLIRDVYPLMLESQIEINVSGEQRIETLGRVIPLGFELTEIQSKLPLRIKRSGEMEVQLDAGRHVIFLTARLTVPTEKFSIDVGENWPKQELWSFEPNRQFRIVDVVGSPIDGRQTNMPEQWQHYSTYLLNPNQDLSIIETSRGDINPDQHDLNLQRKLWLNFDGQGFISEEHLGGSIGYLDRLSAIPGYQAGRVTINDKDTLITSSNEDQGIQILPGNFSMTSTGQLAAKNIAINPWSVNLSAANLSINLPPGYRMFAVRGADAVSNTYIASWRLWEIFIVILFVVVLTRQYSIASGLVGLLYGLSSHNIDGAPGIITLLVIVGLHVSLKLLNTNKVQQLLTYLYRFGLVFIVLSFLPFAVQQARLSIYPQLEKPYAIDTTSSDWRDSIESEQTISLKSSRQTELVKLSDAGLEEVVVTASRETAFKNRFQDGEIVQTGPGMPSWHWNRVDINISGPIVAGQNIELILMPPWLNRSLNLLRVMLFIGLAYLFIRGQEFGQPPKLPLPKAPTAPEPKKSTVAVNAAAIVVMLVLNMVNSPDLSATEFPPQHLLDTYYERLDAPAECMPDCVAVNKLTIQADENSILLNLEVSSLARVPLRLPIDVTALRNLDLSVNQRETPHLFYHQGLAYLLLDAGKHDIQLSLDTTALNQLVLQFDSPPQNTLYRGEGWRVSGIKNQTVPNGRIHLRKQQKQVASEKRLSPAPIETFVRVTREFNLDIDWTITTTVTRIAPPSGAFTLSIPLVEGESVTSPGLTVVDRSLRLDFSDETGQLSWKSDLTRSSPLTLKAAPEGRFHEVWRLHPSTRWHVSYDGIKPIKSTDSSITWYPAAEDQIAITLLQPTPLNGLSTAIDDLSLIYTPGKRQARTRLQLQFRASKGNDYPLNLPPNIDVSRVSLDGHNMIYVETADKITLPVPPGESSFVIEWTEDKPLSLVTKTPTLQIPDATNIKIKTVMPGNRWLLAVRGPLIGPAILFWGVLLVILGIGFILGRQTWSPLRSWEWMLMGTGIATSFWPITVLVVIWFITLSKRNLLIEADTSVNRFRLVQVTIALLTVVMLAALVTSVANSLMFGAPDMQLVGNGSSSQNLNWYQDIVSANLPTTTVISLPMWSYQILMLLWSIWLSISLMKWLQWGWTRFSEHGLWKT